MNRFSISTQDVAILIMLNVSVCQILESGKVTPDIMKELEYLQHKLERMTFTREKGSLQPHSKAL